METLVFCVRPGQDLKNSLDAMARDRDLKAACILSCVGRLRQAVLRFANQPQVTAVEGEFEIVSLVGMFSIRGGPCRITISDGQGCTLCGQLMEGCLISTTARIEIGVFAGVCYLHETGCDKLAVRPDL